MSHVRRDSNAERGKRDNQSAPIDEHPLQKVAMDVPQFLVQCRFRFGCCFADLSAQRRHLTSQVSRELAHFAAELAAQRRHLTSQVTRELAHFAAYLGESGVEMRLESLPVQLVDLLQLIAIGLVHSVEPIHELAGDFITELLVEFA